MSALRDALAVHGIRIERADVVVRSPASPETGAQQQEGGQDSGGAPGERAGDQPEDWVSDGRQTETARDQGAQGSGAEGEQRDNVQDALAAESEATDTTRTTEVSLDLMA